MSTEHDPRVEKAADLAESILEDVASIAPPWPAIAEQSRELAALADEAAREA